MIHPLTPDAENTSEWDDWLMPGVALSQPFTDPPGALKTSGDDTYPSSLLCPPRPDCGLDHNLQ